MRRLGALFVFFQLKRQGLRASKFSVHRWIRPGVLTTNILVHSACSHQLLLMAALTIFPNPSPTAPRLKPEAGALPPWECGSGTHPLPVESQVPLCHAHRTHVSPEVLPGAPKEAMWCRVLIPAGSASKHQGGTARNSCWALQGGAAALGLPPLPISTTETIVAAKKKSSGGYKWPR